MSSKNFIYVFIIILFFPLFLFSNTEKKATNFTKEELLFIKENPKISIAMMNNFKPFSFEEENTHQGFTADILKKIAQNSGLKFEIKTGLWNETFDRFKAQETMMIAGISHTKKREDFTLFTSPYFEIPTFIFGDKEDKHYRNIDSLKDKRVAISKSLYYKDTLIQKGIDIIEVTSSLDKAKMLALGQVDYFLSSFTSGKKAIVSQGYTNIKPIDELDGIKKEDLRFGINPNYPILRSIIEKSLKQISSKEKIYLTNRWIIELKQLQGDFLTLEKHELNYLKTHKTITMCNDPSWAPIEFAYNKNPNDIRGIAIDTLYLLEKKLGVTFKTIPSNSWQESIRLFKEKKCDILPAVGQTQKRKVFASFTKDYLQLPLAIFTTKDKPLIGSLQELKNQTWARQEDSSIIELVSGHTNDLKLIKTKNNAEALQLVSDEKVDFTIATLPTAYYIMSQYLIDNIKVAGYTDIFHKLSIGVQPEDKQLLVILNKALDTISQEQAATIFKKWVSPKQIAEPFNYRLLGQIVLIIFILILALLYRQKILKSANNNLERMVDAKTKELQEINQTLERRIKEEVNKNRDKDKLLAHQSKMVALSEMLENIAHQWRQPLSMISTSISGLKIRSEMDLEEDKKELRTTYNMVIEQTQHLSQTIEDFRTYFTGDTHNKERFDIKEVILKIEDLTKDIYEQCSINYIYDVQECALEYNRNLLIQALINIYNNARDAMVENTIPCQQRLLLVSSKQENNQLVITIQDGGGGIPEDIIEKIFEPYYSTKHQSIGTGLGLYMTHQIITQQLHGNIKVENREFTYQEITYKGALFTITLPI